jgi:hypothetical protein
LYGIWVCYYCYVLMFRKDVCFVCRFSICGIFLGYLETYISWLFIVPPWCHISIRVPVVQDMLCICGYVFVVLHCFNVFVIVLEHNKIKLYKGRGVQVGSECGSL